MRLPCTRLLSSLSSRLLISDEVSTALSEGRGVVSLESTVITHGLPYPTNLKTAESLEKVVREGLGIPATIALMDGKIKVGLTSDELERIAQEKGTVKVSRRDMAYALNKGLTGGTTVASTMWAAHQAGISVFSTGGIGGVHRGAEDTFDISADLTELARTPVTVVCAGIKSILDIGKTLEVLETNGVNALVFGDRNVFPGFFSSTTPFKGQTNSRSIEEIADIIRMSASLGLEAGTILAVPLPSHMEAEGKVIEEAIQNALIDAREKGVRGQAITPFLLQQVANATKGSSIKTNVALLENNARVATSLAVCLAEKKREKKSRIVATHLQKEKKKPKIVAVGASILDFEAITNDTLKRDGGSYAGNVVQRLGGVGRNHGEALGRLGCDVTLLSSVGDDVHGRTILDKTAQIIDVSRVLQVKDGPSTAVYMSLNEKGNVLYGISCVEEMVQTITPQYIQDNEEVLSRSEYVVADANLPIETLSSLFKITGYHKKKVWFEPTDISKATKFLRTPFSNSVSVISPNAREFLAILSHCGISAPESAIESTTSLASFLTSVSLPHSLSQLDLILITLASQGSLLITRSPKFGVSKYKNSECSWGMLHTVPPPSIANVLSVSGAGDTMNSGILSSLLHGYSLDEAIDFSLRAVFLTLSSTDAVATALSNLPFSSIR